MSALGQKRTFAVQKGMSALPPKATLNAFMRDPALKSSLGVLIDFLVIPRKRMALLAQSRC
jgi:hypothetical protein